MEIAFLTSGCPAVPWIRQFLPTIHPHYSKVARPLTELTKKTAETWTWTPEAELAFQKLKQLFTSAPILAHFNPQKTVIVEPDALDFALAAFLTQRDEETACTQSPSILESCHLRKSITTTTNS